LWPTGLCSNFYVFKCAPTRKKLDEHFALEVLRLTVSLVQPEGPLELVRMKLAQEPSIRGGKATSEDEEDLEETGGD
jgi:hypothetical protein